MTGLLSKFLKQPFHKRQRRVDYERLGLDEDQTLLNQFSDKAGRRKQNG